MRKLAKLIETELEKQDVCAVYNSHLGRVWPRSMGAAKRKQLIKGFADSRALDVTFYDVGLCAIFEKKKASAKSARRVLVLDGHHDDDEEEKRSRPRRNRRS